MERELSKLQESCLTFAKVLLAAGVVWKDTTSYSRDSKEKIPTGFSTNVGECRITITCGHRDYKPSWVFHCYELGFDTKFLGEGLSAQEAAEKAVGICGDKAKKLYDAFSTCS
jgi:hypothetical protein